MASNIDTLPLQLTNSTMPNQTWPQGPITTNTRLFRVLVPSVTYDHSCLPTLPVQCADNLPLLMLLIPVAGRSAIQATFACNHRELPNNVPCRLLVLPLLENYCQVEVLSL